ncbi:MAG: LppX_LprAFG lipoprotein [Nocardioides sp.]
MIWTRLVLGPVALLLAVLLAGCSGDDGPAADEQTPAEVLAAARATLDETSGLSIDLTTPGLPDGVQGISGAKGVITSAPAFEGEIVVVLSGTTFSVPVVAVGGTVFAQLPLTTRYQDIDPGEYNAPDPAGLVTGKTGFPRLLPATTDVEEGESVRGGANNEEVLTSYTGTVPGAAMKKVIPSSAGDSFTASYQITEDGELREATFVGAFYPNAEDMTYTVTFEDYGTEKKITAP